MENSQDPGAILRFSRQMTKSIYRLTNHANDEIDKRKCESKAVLNVSKIIRSDFRTAQRVLAGFSTNRDWWKRDWAS